ncbi:MAG: PAS domain-containing protein [Bacteroidota bacterium]
MQKIKTASTTAKLVSQKKKITLALNVSIYHEAFENTAQANIISNLMSGKIVAVNTAACLLLGYSKKELLTKKRAGIFKDNENDLKKNLLSKNGQYNSSVISIKKTGASFMSEITSAVFMNENNIQNVITTITDKSQSILDQKNIDTKKEKIVAGNIVYAQKISDTKIAENDQWIKHIAKSSYDIMWDWDINSGEIYVGDSVKEVFGYSIPNNMISIEEFTNCLLIDEKDKVIKKITIALKSKRKSWEDSFMIRRLDNSLACAISRATIVRDSNGRAINLIGAIKDVSEVTDLEGALKEQLVEKKEQANILNITSKLSYDGIWDWNINTNKFYLSAGFEKLFGLSLNNVKNGKIDWISFVHTDDKDKITNGITIALASAKNYWEDAFRFIKDNGIIANVFSRATIIRDAKGGASRMIGVVHDISQQKNLEEKLASEIRTKNIQISEATEDAKEMERSDIGKELHDNVNQLLGASKLYMEMAGEGGAESRKYLERSSEYTITAIEEIRKLTKGLTTDIIKNLGLCPAIKKLAEDMSEVNPIKITCALKSFIEESVNDKFKLNIFRIVQEQMNNILKHAKATQIGITLLQNKNAIILLITDNGIGFNTDREKQGIGVANIKSRVASFNGTINFISQPGEGCVLNINFPITETMFNKPQ